MIWDQLPEAAALLASCAARPPETRMVKVTDLTVRYEQRYVGARVRQLNAIHRREADRIFAESQASGNYDPFDTHCRLSVQEAVRKAVLSQPMRKVA
jgi:hypothetical protein